MYSFNWKRTAYVFQAIWVREMQVERFINGYWLSLIQEKWTKKGIREWKQKKKVPTTMQVHLKQEIVELTLTNFSPICEHLQQKWPRPLGSGNPSTATLDLLIVFFSCFFSCLLY